MALTIQQFGRRQTVAGDLKTGKELWRREESGDWSSYKAKAAEGKLLLPLFRQKGAEEIEVRMLCLDQADGKVLWQKDADFS